MSHEIIDCIDAGSEFCPCHLAESGDCILCSQLCGKEFCDCINWKGVCIFQEYRWNGEKAKEGRKTYSSTILDKEPLAKDIFIFTIAVTHALAQNLVYPGSFVFLRKEGTSELYNSPISIMEVDTEKNFIKVVVKACAVKTKTICELEKGDLILVKGPFWNGALGLKRINEAKNKTSLIIIKGIGQAPAVQVMKQLYNNGNKIIALIDTGDVGDIFINKYLDKYNVKVIKSKSSIFDGEDITKELKDYITTFMNTEDLNLIHCAAHDLIILKLIQYVNEKVNVSCSNNAKMCCGEGLCGSCTCFKGTKVKRMCKVQVNPEYLFNERRLI